MLSGWYSDTTVWIGIAAVTMGYLVYRKTRLTFNYPPSLPWLPVVGSLPFISGLDTIHIFFTEKAKQYGNVYTLYFGSK